MAGIIANTYQVYTAKGLRENLGDVIYRISPEETPLVSGIGKGSTKQTLTEWQSDALAATSTSNAQLDGDDVTTFPSITPTVRMGNYSQIMRKLLIVSGTLEAVDKAGRDSEIRYQTVMRGLELRRDLEANLFAMVGGNAGDSTTARTFAALGAWVKTNVDKEAGGTNPAWSSGVPAAARTDSGSPRAFTETIFKNVVSLGYASGASIGSWSCYLGPVNKGKASAFGGVATKNYDLSGRPRPTAVIGSADVYVSEFGVISLVPSRFQRERDAWFIDHSYLSVLFLRPMQTVMLAKTGDAEKRMLIQELTFKVGHEAALGLAADLTTS